VLRACGTLALGAFENIDDLFRAFYSKIAIRLPGEQRYPFFMEIYDALEQSFIVFIKFFTIIVKNVIQRSHDHTLITPGFNIL